VCETERFVFFVVSSLFFVFVFGRRLKKGVCCGVERLLIQQLAKKSKSNRKELTETMRVRGGEQRGRRITSLHRTEPGVRECVCVTQTGRDRKRA